MAKSRLKGRKKPKMAKTVKALKKAAQINDKRARKQSKAQNNEQKRLTKKQRRRLESEARRKTYVQGQKILLVGEGNFSFAKALCEKLGNQPGVIATTFDSKEVCAKKYEDAKANKLDIRKMNGEILHNVDARNLLGTHDGLFKQAFDRIIFNFPHLGHGEKDMEKNIRDHQEFFEHFFRSAVECLKPDSRSEIHVSLKEGEPYKSWKIGPCCTRGAPNLEIKTAISFQPQQWPGYEHRRTIGFEPLFSTQDNLDIQKGAMTYIFGFKRKQDENGEK